MFHRSSYAVKHSLHPHKMRLIKDSQGTWVCDNCSGTSGNRYRVSGILKLLPCTPPSLVPPLQCNQCDFDLDQNCWAKEFKGNHLSVACFLHFCVVWTSVGDAQYSAPCTLTGVAAAAPTPAPAAANASNGGVSASGST